MVFLFSIISNFWSLLILVVFVVLIFVKVNFPKIKGAFGERLVKKALSKLDSSYIVFHDIYVPNEKGMAQIDHIVTSPYGIFVIETKHYNGWIFGSEKQTYWTQVIYKRKEKLYNPIRQNYGHIQSLKYFLGKDDFPYVYSIIAFSTQSTFKFKESFSSAKVIHIPQIVKVIKEKKEIVLNDLELKEINGLLEQLNSKSKQEKRMMKKRHIQQVKHNVKDKKVIPLKKVCPKCGGKLIIKNGKFGSFYGCSNFPQCKYTKKIG